MIRRESGELKSEVGRTHCENWNGSRRLLYAPCTEDLAYVQLTSLKGDERGNQVPIDRDFWCDLFPHLAWIIERIPDDGRGDWFDLIRTRGWAKGAVALVGDAASAQPPFLGQGGGCAMMSAYVLAEAIDRAGDVATGLAEWQRRQRRFTEWVQRVAHWYGQLALLPTPLHLATFFVPSGPARSCRRRRFSSPRAATRPRRKPGAGLRTCRSRSRSSTEDDRPPHDRSHYAQAHACKAPGVRLLPVD